MLLFKVKLLLFLVKNDMITIKNALEISNMRKAGKLVALINQELANMIKPDINGKMLDKKAQEIIKNHNAKASFLNYHGFKASICVSVNEQLIHGIPNSKPFKTGDIIKIDAGAAINGYHADAAFTIVVGKPSLEQAKIVDVTKTALAKAIAILKPKVRIGDISHTIETFVKSQGFYLPTSYTGHGIGKLLHEAPVIPNAGMKPDTGVALRAGMTICIEPMVQTSTAEVRVLKDG